MTSLRIYVTIYQAIFALSTNMALRLPELWQKANNLQKNADFMGWYLVNTVVVLCTGKSFLYILFRHSKPENLIVGK